MFSVECFYRDYRLFDYNVELRSYVGLLRCSIVFSLALRLYVVCTDPEF